MTQRQGRLVQDRLRLTVRAISRDGTLGGYKYLQGRWEVPCSWVRSCTKYLHLRERTGYAGNRQGRGQGNKGNKDMDFPYTVDCPFRFPLAARTRHGTYMYDPCFLPMQLHSPLAPVPFLLPIETFPFLALRSLTDLLGFSKGGAAYSRSLPQYSFLLLHTSIFFQSIPDDLT